LEIAEHRLARAAHATQIAGLDLLDDAIERTAADDVAQRAVLFFARAVGIGAKGGLGDDAKILIPHLFARQCPLAWLVHVLGAKDGVDVVVDGDGRRAVAATQTRAARYFDVFASLDQFP